MVVIETGSGGVIVTPWRREPDGVRVGGQGEAGS